MIDQKDDGSQNEHQRADGRRVLHGDLLRADPRNVFRRDFTEQDDQDRQDRGPDRDKTGTEIPDNQGCGQRRRGQIDNIVADQDRGEHFAVLIKDRKNQSGTPVSFVGKCL